MENLRDIICNGPSMRPTILPGDKIEVQETDFNKLTPGDIIIYNNPDDIRLNIIHRIIKRDADSLTTRGDNNSHIDPYKVRPEHLPLKVRSIQRGNHKIKVSCGGKGLFIHRIRLAQRIARVFKSKYLNPIYVFIANTGIFYIFGFIFKTEVRKFKRPANIEYQLFSGKKRIGKFDAKTQKWHLKFPWRLFINPSKLKTD
jgi:signal peptidase I